jgi:hypothetical protein
MSSYNFLTPKKLISGSSTWCPLAGNERLTFPKGISLID